MSKWNLLPDDVIYRIYQFKHQLDMKDSLRTIERFRYRKYEHSNVYFNCISPIKDLLKRRISTKKIYIDLSNYAYVGEEECYFRMDPEYMEVIAQKLDITIRPFYECLMDTYPIAVMIKYNNSRLKNPVTLIEMIELLALLKISFVSFMDRQISVTNIYTTKYNYQVTNINLYVVCC